MKIVEYRGIEGLVYAPITEDSSENFTTGEVKELAGTSELTRSTESSSEVHYYDNMPAITIESTGSDEVTCTVSAIPLDVLADITGQVYDAATDMFVEGARESKYYALGYKTKKTDGTEVYVWRLKGTFSFQNPPISRRTMEQMQTVRNLPIQVFLPPTNSQRLARVRKLSTF